MHKLVKLLFLVSFIAIFLSPSTLLIASDVDTEEVCPCGTDEDGECLPCPIDE